jgi:hypothetical protein
MFAGRVSPLLLRTALPVLRPAPGLLSARALSGASDLGKGIDLLNSRVNVSINGYVPNTGFMVTDPNIGEDVDIYGSLIAAQKSVFLWRAKDGALTDFDLSKREYSADFYEPLISYFTLQPPAPEHTQLLIFGVHRQRLGDSITGHIPASVISRLKEVAPDTNVEVMETGVAIATFNILMAEGRSVVAAMIM